MNRFEYEDFDYNEIVDEEFLSDCRTKGEPLTREDIDREARGLAHFKYSKKELYDQLLSYKEFCESPQCCIWLHGLSEEDRNIELNNIKIREGIYKKAIEEAPEESWREIAERKHKEAMKAFREEYPYLCKEYHMGKEITSELKV